jgi:uncharacterized protein DUF4440
MKAASTLIVVVAISISSLLLERPRISAAAAQLPDSHDAGTNAGSLQQQIVAKEREGLDALKTTNLELFGNLTADDAVFVDAQGPASKAQVLKNVVGFTLTDYSMEDVRFVPLSAKSGLIEYKITEKGVSHGKEFAAQAYVSSIWAEREGKWLCLFSQETATRPVVAK